MVDTNLFFRIWTIYRDHWGIESHRQELFQMGCKMLQRRILSSSRLKNAIVFYALFLEGYIQNPMQSIATDRDYLFSFIRTIADHLLQERYSCNYALMDPMTRLHSGIHAPIKDQLDRPPLRHLRHLNFPLITDPDLEEGMKLEDDSVSRVYAIVADFT